jgi:hypothetical protein
MKTQFFKNVMPFAVIALGISGAFVTTSMQKASKTVLPQIGYSLNAQGECSNTSTSCDNEEKDFICRVTTGAQAFGKDASGNCVVKLWRPE